MSFNTGPLSSYNFPHAKQGTHFSLQDASQLVARGAKNTHLPPGATVKQSDDSRLSKDREKEKKKKKRGPARAYDQEGQKHEDDEHPDSPSLEIQA